MSVLQQGNVGLTETFEQYVNFMPDGSAEAVMKYRVPWNTLFSYVPTALQPHPTFSSLLYYDGEASKEEGDVGNLINHYRGIYASNPSAFEQVDGQISTTAEPLETAPIFYGPTRPANPTGFDDIAAPLNHYDINAVNLALQTNADPIFSGYPGGYSQGPKAYSYYLKKITGRDSYFRVGYTWRRHFCTTAVPDYTNFVGYIVIPPTTPFAPPTPPNPSQNYLFSGIGWRQQGGVVTVDEEYTLSGPGGWDIDLYSFPG